jgi:hypothetical protein
VWDFTTITPTVQFTASTFSVNETGGSATIGVVLSGSAGQIVSVNYATSNGTATAGSDYTTASGTLTFAPGQTSKTFNVPITNDMLDEPNETVNLTLSSPVNATLGTPTSAILTIVDDDIPCYSLTTGVSPSGWGSVNVSPSPNCAGGKYPAGTVVQLTAIPNSGYVFNYWSGSVSGSANPTAVTMNGDRSVTANFIGGIVNPGFESGPTGWIQYSLKGWPVIVDAANLAVVPHSGNWAVWLGGDFDEIAYIQQQVTVPSGSPYLAYWHWIGSEDDCGFDFGSVVINSTTVVDVYDLCLSTETGGWVHHVVNLGAYAGQSVSLQIRVETDSILNSNLFVDDVSFQATATVVGTSGPDNLTPSNLNVAMPKQDKVAIQEAVEETEGEFLLRPSNWTPRNK